mgnify:CR=1 FL=1
MSKTVTVRIPVAVDENGDWYSPEAGSLWQGPNHQAEELGEASDWFGGVTNACFITAEVPLPEPAEVEGGGSREGNDGR